MADKRVTMLGVPLGNRLKSSSMPRILKYPVLAVYWFLVAIAYVLIWTLVIGVIGLLGYLLATALR